MRRTENKDKPTRGNRLMDNETRSMLYEGCSLSQLSSIFELDNRDIARRIRHVAPCGERMKYPIYAIKDVAGYLVPPNQADVEAAIKRLHPRDLPPSLTKEYWAGRHARLKFEEDNGDLWRTADVIEMLSDVFKTMRMSILLINDQVERQTDLTNRQRDIIQGIIDGLLNDLQASLIKRFENEKVTGSSHDSGWTDPGIDEGEEDL